jgi:hypothetical protein
MDRNWFHWHHRCHWCHCYHWITIVTEGSPLSPFVLFLPMDHYSHQWVAIVANGSPSAAIKWREWCPSVSGDLVTPLASGDWVYHWRHWSHRHWIVIDDILFSLLAAIVWIQIRFDLFTDYSNTSAFAMLHLWFLNSHVDREGPIVFFKIDDIFNEWWRWVSNQAEEFMSKWYLPYYTKFSDQVFITFSYLLTFVLKTQLSGCVIVTVTNICKDL